MRFLIAAILYGVASVVAAAPFCRATVATGTTHCVWTVNGIQSTVTVSGTTCQVDVGQVPVGPNACNAAARVIDPVWGNADSAVSATLNFTRPAAPSTPTGLTLTP